MNISFHLIHYESDLNIFAPASYLEDINRLLLVINPKSKPATAESLHGFFVGRGILAFACEGGRLVGMATICTLPKVNGYGYRVEHVGVLPSHEGNGIGRKLCELVISTANIFSMHPLDMTSSPKRERANRLYESLGFALRETNSRRLLTPQAPTL